MKAQTHKQARSAAAKQVEAESTLELPEGYELVLSKPTTAAKRRAAAKYLLDNMPPACTGKQKPAHILLADYRRGK